MAAGRRCLAIRVVRLSRAPSPRKVLAARGRRMFLIRARSVGIAVRSEEILSSVWTRGLATVAFTVWDKP